MSENKPLPSVIIHVENCMACGLCIAECPDKALTADTTRLNEAGFHPVKWSGQCRLCGRCYIVCPHLAVEIRREDK